ncbi:protealysin inhibitor emfourin [Microbacterium sp. 179-I 3D3 NHS]|uniref:protealysin inhibitor emfourin n=1 Tax=Microbacterium sp. 179-I 3D3 NHS TaxID=3142382 RepID=UPI0039A34FEB
MSESPPPTDVRVVIAVVRSGGIAGMRRQWRVEADAPDADDWISLIENCPWDQQADAATGADRFVWSIRARTPSERRERDLSDEEIDGPWRTLVDAVREASRRDGR